MGAVKVTPGFPEIENKRLNVRMTPSSFSITSVHHVCYSDHDSRVYLRYGLLNLVASAIC